MATLSNCNHVKIDECGRFWFSLGDYGVKIYDNQGLFLGNLTFTNTSIFDTIITDDYIIYLSDTRSNRVIRIDPDIQC
jgi:sugar lactone lactonase YvrE